MLSKDEGPATGSTLRKLSSEVENVLQVKRALLHYVKFIVIEISKCND